MNCPWLIEFHSSKFHSKVKNLSEIVPKNQICMQQTVFSLKERPYIGDKKFQAYTPLRF